MKTMPRAVVWTVLILMSFVFVMLGLSKFTGRSSTRWAERFAHWGCPVALRHAVGALEIVGGIGLIVPVATRPAAGALMVVMAGAFYTHLSHGEILRVVPPLVLGTFALLYGGIHLDVLQGYRADNLVVTVVSKRLLSVAVSWTIHLAETMAPSN